MDGWGTARLARRWSEIHDALLQGRRPPPVAAPPYRAFIAESLAYRDSPAFLRDGDYWRAQLPALPPMLKDADLSLHPIGPHLAGLLIRELNLRARTGVSIVASALLGR